MSDPVQLGIIAAVQTVVILLINKLFGDRRARKTQSQVRGVAAQVDAISRKPGE